MSKAEIKRKALRDLIATGKTLVVPGTHDALSARLVERAGFPAVYIGSYATSAAAFGLPDVGLLAMDEMAAHAKRVADAVAIPVLADAENGWNNAANIWRTVRAFEQAGVCGIHIEDHEFGKHADVPQVLLSTDEMVQKIHAAIDAREDENFLIIARTDAAWAFRDIEDAIARMNAFTAAGADLVMPVGISPMKLKDLRARIEGKVVATDTPGRSVEDEEAAGVDVVLYYGFSLYATYAGVTAALDTFRRTRDADAAHVRDEIAAFEEFIGYAEFSARAKKYGLG
jgi:2-methylisocitrate lyase-like PEP mutase family enzyme